MADDEARRYTPNVVTRSNGRSPDCKSNNIFKGEPVDLNQILSALYRVTVAEELKARVGETDIALGPVEATRKVSTSSDWSMAWRRAS